MGAQPYMLFTGATGFLGSNLLKQIVSQDAYRIIILKRETSNLSRISSVVEQLEMYNVENLDFEKLFQQRQIDTILHCATNYGRSSANSLEIVEANLLLPLRLLEMGKQHGTRCFINTDTVLDKRLNDYSLSKKQFRQWLEVYAASMTCINVEIEHFYGPSDDASKFVTYIIQQLIREVSTIPLTAGEQKRCFIYIDDVVNAFELLLSESSTRGAGFYNYQVGTTETIRIRDFVEKVKSLSGNTRTRLQFGALPYRENEKMTVDLDLSGLQGIGWRPRVNLDEGIKRTIEYERSLSHS